MIKLSIIIVNWNAREFLLRCLASIYENCRQPFFEIIVVDNLSSDGSIPAVKARFKNVTVIENNENNGFSQGNNIGIKKSIGDYVLILNPDTEVLAGALEKLVEFLDRHAEVWAVGPKILNSDGTVQFTCAREFPTPLSEFMAYSILFRPFLTNKTIGRYNMAYWDHLDSRPINCLSGACMLVRKTAFETMGFFDERFFMYAEDIDFCYRIQKSGGRCWYLAETAIIHYGGQSSRQVVGKTYYRYYESMYLFYRKHRGAGSAFGYKSLMLLYGVFTLPFFLIKVIIDKKTGAEMSARIQSLRQIIRWALCSRGGGNV